ncbi:hypothetical protein QA648_36835 (plasmid) [Rhizobium sp. CB3171]|uniref:hypothetical protein n=1 Tax=Rhizobium sp. CB3171 TaxID=3039157 RepID=UPI0024B0CA5F|nr:hypothetical protein [Rhizobium sp. CB3171]WFU07546.1 hypothetical protein QA648_36835 [Rhizobium sp. CB3171]
MKRVLIEVYLGLAVAAMIVGRWVLALTHFVFGAPKPDENYRQLREAESELFVRRVTGRRLHDA